ncbi:MAG: glycosyltransferase [Mariprofundaceae bacterium]
MPTRDGQARPGKDRRNRHANTIPDRRRSPRYIGHFPVRLHIGSGDDERTETVIAHDISDGGLMLGNVDLPDSIKRLRVRFRIPRSLSPDDDIERQMDVRVRYHDHEQTRTGLAFQRRLPRRLLHRTWRTLRLGVELAMIIALVLALGFEAADSPYFRMYPLLFAYTLTLGFYLLSRFCFSLFYNPPRPRLDLPTVSIIIPARNEQKHVAHTIGCALNADYPADKLQVIAINDGSRDGTLATMLRLRNEYPQLQVLDFGEGRGKRHAVAAGARMATGDIVVFVDAGSFLESDAIRHIVDGFANLDVAGVCGHCDISNANHSLLTRMQAVRYFITYRIMRATESIFGGVTLLSGPFAAYRKQHLLNVLDDWVRQRFLGNIAVQGDDRALTNMLLSHHKIIYDRRAVTRALVPEDGGSFLKLQMRWRRSWLREGIHASSFMWRKRPLMSIAFYAGMLLTLAAPAIVVRSVLDISLGQTSLSLTYLSMVLTVAAAVCALLLLVMRARFWFYGIPYVIFYALLLLAQVPWAILTFWKPHDRDA